MTIENKTNKISVIDVNVRGEKLLESSDSGSGDLV